jgi:hypothetical protein
MIEMLVDLDFACCNCGTNGGVKLKCAGKGLTGGGNCVAAVHVPCPTCKSVNELYFEPNGTVRAVKPVRPPWAFPPQPSLN